MKTYIKPNTKAVFVDSQRFMDTLSGDPDKVVNNENQFLGKEEETISSPSLWDEEE